MIRSLLSAGLVAGVLFAGVMAQPGSARAETPALTATDNSPCRDPWINYAYRTQFNRKPIGTGNAGECNIYLYAQGRWQSYDQLRDAVKGFVNATSNAGATMQSVGGVYKLVNRATGGAFAKQVVQIVDASGARKVVDMMGQFLSSFGLLSAEDKQVPLSGGGTLVLR